MAEFTVGQRVRHSGHVLQKKRDYWNSCGREPMKSGAKRALDAAIAERGIVTAILPVRGVSPGIEVKWDNGGLSRCLSYLVIADRTGLSERVTDVARVILSPTQAAAIQRQPSPIRSIT